jgi:hypothetical protein
VSIGADGRQAPARPSPDAGDPASDDGLAPELEIEIEVLRGAPDEDELAALIAVVTEGYASEAAAAVARPHVRSAWSLSQRAMRAPLRRELGWGRFGG